MLSRDGVEQLILIKRMCAKIDPKIKFFLKSNGGCLWNARVDSIARAEPNKILKPKGLHIVFAAAVSAAAWSLAHK